MTSCTATHEFSTGDVVTCNRQDKHEDGHMFESKLVYAEGQEPGTAPVKKSFFGKVTPAPVEAVEEAPKPKGKK